MWNQERCECGIVTKVGADGSQEYLIYAAASSRHRCCIVDGGGRSSRTLRIQGEILVFSLLRNDVL